jgi:hypothetical protein
VRHVRILGLCLLALFAMSAATAGSALAKQPKPGSKNPKEWLKFENCSLNQGAKACIWGESGKGTYFQAGKITVNFTKPIFLEGGAHQGESFECTEEDKNLYAQCQRGDSDYTLEDFIGPEHGNSTLSKAAQPAPSLTEVVDTELLSPAELERYNKYVAEGKTKVTATVELVGDPSTFFLDEENLLGGVGEALGLPVQIKLSNPFLGKTCSDGSNSEPIQISYTTGTTNPPPPNVPMEGKPGELFSTNEGEIVHIVEGKLVDNSYAAPGVTGCGIGGNADAAVNAAEGLPSPAGSNATVLEGELAQTGHFALEEARGRGL